MSARLIGNPTKPVTLKPRSKQNGRSRKPTVDKATFDSNWDAIFNKDKKAK